VLSGKKSGDCVMLIFDNLLMNMLFERYLRAFFVVLVVTNGVGSFCQHCNVWSKSAGSNSCAGSSLLLDQHLKFL